MVPDEVEPYGRTKAKIDLGVLDRLRDRRREADLRHGDHADEGRRGQDDDLCLARAGPRTHRPSSVLCLREASLGPVFGIKGGAAGGGYAQVVPMEDLNLHFTGDIHAIGAANNLLAAMLEAHILHGNALGIDPLSVGWRRCVDINDRALRNVAIGLGGRANGYLRESGFDITAASEVMAIVAVARDLHDLRQRLARSRSPTRYEGEPVLAEQLRRRRRDGRPAQGRAQAEPRPDARGPAGVRPLRPVREHRARQQLARRRPRRAQARRLRRHESGFGADMGMEKFLNIVCRAGGLSPSAVVLVATAKALKHHGGDADGGLDAIEQGRQPAAPSRDRRRVRPAGGRRGQPVPGRHGRGGRARPAARARARRARGRAERGVRARRRGRGRARGGGRRTPPTMPNEFEFTYPIDAPIEAKIEAIATRVYGAGGVVFLQTAKNKIKQYAAGGLDRLPICMAKTHLSLSHDPELTNAPTGFELTVRDVRAYTGAGWLVALCGTMQTMPGLGATPAAFNVDIDENGRTVGLF